MQSLWSLKIDWIDELPSERAKEWHRFLEDFNSVRSICIGRCIVHPQATRVELHGFADASEKCYGAVIYCRSQSPDGSTTVKPVTSKSRVAPVKSVTMPRLELCAAVLLAKLMKRVETALQMKTPPVYLWSDSTIVLAWIQKEPNLLKTFVANRVATIQHLTNAEQWHHVSSEQNPADLVSRGLDPSSLLNNSLWWNGPKFLMTKDFPEKNTLSSVTDNDEFNCEFKNKDGVLRVGGRLCNSDLNFECKFPVILPCNHKLTNLIVEYFHLKYFHLGPQALLYQVRQRFWPLKGRNVCRKIVHDCLVCFKVKPITCEQIMGNLPKERVRENFPFDCSGIDFIGPFWIKSNKQRKSSLYKIYVSIFVCFVTKAVHFELVSDLTTQTFIASLKRFIARRGRPSLIFSDNGKTFIGANAELKRLYKLVINPDPELAGFLVDENINWKFLPPRAPNFGGLWEAGIKSFKFHFKREAGNSRFTYEEFLTIMTQIEGILNSRPLTPLSMDIDDLSVLTPAHFLIGRPITSINEPNIIHIETNRLNIYQRLTKIVQSIWKRWSNNYLSNFQQRSKWKFEKDNARVGDLVLIKEDNLAVNKWLMGRLIEVFSGKDNRIRVVTIKTQHGVVKRPISKICILPMRE
ncbi:integrase catalytic domain-containing protein [Trichonephila clavipes]|nr:integrase catalytic domain-containing protein [Trichonephila clavipes]